MLDTNLFPQPPRQNFEETLPTGISSLDAFLGGGWLRGSVSELVGPPGSGKISLATQTIVDLTQKKNWVCLISRQKEFFPPALAREGVNLDQLLWLRPENNERCLWSVEQISRSALFPLLITYGIQNSRSSLRRLQLNLEKSGHVLLLLEDQLSSKNTWASGLRIQVQRRSFRRLFLNILRSKKYLPQRELEISFHEKKNLSSLPSHTSKVRLAS